MLRLGIGGASVVPGIRNLVRRWDPVMYNGAGGRSESVLVVRGAVWLRTGCVVEEVEVLEGCRWCVAVGAFWER